MKMPEKREWTLIKNGLATLTQYYLGDILNGYLVDELNEREICRILRRGDGTARQCAETCGPGAKADVGVITTCHAGLSFFIFHCPHGRDGEDIRVIGGKVITRFPGREESMDLAARANVEPHLIIEAMGDVRVDTIENLLTTRSLVEKVCTLMFCEKPEAHCMKETDIALV